MTAVTRMLYNDSGSRWCTRGWCRQRTYRRDMVRGWRGEVDRYIQYLSMYIYSERERGGTLDTLQSTTHTTTHVTRWSCIRALRVCEVCVRGSVIGVEGKPRGSRMKSWVEDVVFGDGTGRDHG